MPGITQIDRLHIDKGLGSYSAIKDQIEQTTFLVRVFGWKTGIGRNLPPVWCILGGTGAGKSAIFNSILSSDISDVGVKRPCTMTAIVMAHNMYAQALLQAPVTYEGDNRQANLLLDSKQELNNAILIDTPDFDSIAQENKLIAQRFLVLSDVVVFVTSQEKYGDLACRQMLEEANDWGKKIILVLNKVTSNVAYDEYTEFTNTLKTVDKPVVIPRLDGVPTRIDGLTNNPQIANLLFAAPRSTINVNIKSHEINHLKSRALTSVESLRSSIQKEIDRISQVNSEIEEISRSISKELKSQLDAIVSQDVEKRMKSRLQALLRKYDILFVPRLMLRNALKSVAGYVSELLFSNTRQEDNYQDDREIRFEDFSGVESIAPLGPLDKAVTNLNLRVAELLSSNPGYEDLKSYSLKNVKRFDYDTIKSMYGDAFPGLENLLEAEFENLRQGLTRFDEIKLYGSYTLWALLLITFEIVIGGGLTLLDLLLNSVIVPFIPKWLLDLKILDILKSIARRVDLEHKACLQGIVTKQSAMYTDSFASMAPDKEAIEGIEELAHRISFART